MFISIFEYNNIFSGPNNEVQKQGYSSQQSAVLYSALISAMQSTFSRGTLWFLTSLFPLASWKTRKRFELGKQNPW